MSGKMSEEQVRELAPRVGRFSNGIIELGKANELSPDMMIGAFGMLAKQSVAHMVERQGMDEERAIAMVMACFERGILTALHAERKRKEAGNE